MRERGARQPAVVPGAGEAAGGAAPGWGVAITGGEAAPEGRGDVEGDADGDTFGVGVGSGLGTGTPASAGGPDAVDGGCAAALISAGSPGDPPTAGADGSSRSTYPKVG